VLRTLARHAELDAKVEEAKTLIPATTSLELVFGMLDRFRKGYVADTDLWQFSQDFGSSTPFGNFCALSHELHRRQPPTCLASSNRLSLRDLGLLVFPVASGEYNEMIQAKNDAEARSVLYLLRNSEPCPGCGTRVQRDADAMGCPSVTCTVCGTLFRCFVVVSDHVSLETLGPIPASTQFQLYRLIDTAAHVAVDLEKERKQLLLLGLETVATLKQAFTEISEGRLRFGVDDLRRALFAKQIFVSERDLDIFWRRFSLSSHEVDFEKFSQQLRPRLASGAF
jgi:hypothetical protein